MLFLAERVDRDDLGRAPRLRRFFAPPRRACAAAAGSGLRLGAARTSPARADAAGGAALFGSAGCSLTRGSSLKPNGTDGSVKPVIASNGTVSRSGLREKLRLTSKASWVTARSQNSCCRMIDISSGKRLLIAGGTTTPGRLGLEGDVEMMIAGKAGARRVGQHLAHDGAQRVLDEKVVADEVGRHEGGSRREVHGI